MNRKKIYLLMFISTWFWAGAFVAGKYCAPYIPPFTLVFLRFLMAAAVLKAAMETVPIEKKYKMQKGDIKLQIILGALGMFGYHVLFFASLHYTTAINASIIAAANPMLTVLLGTVVFKQYMTKQIVAGVLLSFAGVFMTITGLNWEVISSLTFNSGDLLMLAAILLWCTFLLLSRKSAVPPIRLTLNNFTIAAALSFPLFLLESPLSWVFAATPAAWISVVYMAICPSVFSYCVMQISVKELGAQRTSVFANFVPAFSMILAVLILGENFEIMKLLTMILIVTGVIICQK